jgi:hypothetical protein
MEFNYSRKILIQGHKPISEYDKFLYRYFFMKSLATLNNLELDLEFLMLKCSATVCFTNGDQGSEMIIFESILTTFLGSVIFRDHCGICKIWLELKIEPS